MVRFARKVWYPKNCSGIHGLKSCTFPFIIQAHLEIFLICSSEGLPMWNGTPTSWNDAAFVGWARALTNAHPPTAPQAKSYKKTAAYAPYPNRQYPKLGVKKGLAGQPPRQWRRRKKHGGIPISCKSTPQGSKKRRKNDNRVDQPLGRMSCSPSCFSLFGVLCQGLLSWHFIPPFFGSMRGGAGCYEYSFLYAGTLANPVPDHTNAASGRQRK